MIFRRVLASLIAGKAMAACAVCALWLLGTAAYLLFLPWLGAAGAAAALAFVVALIVGVAGVAAAAALAPKSSTARHTPPPEGTARDSAARVVAFVRTRPVTAVSAAALAAAVAATSPRLFLLAVRGLLARPRSTA